MQQPWWDGAPIGPTPAIKHLAEYGPAHFPNLDDAASAWAASDWRDVIAFFRSHDLP
jgi:hypothetical protein